jgi:hypothetical protein
VCGPEDNRHTPECTENGARRSNRMADPFHAAGLTVWL